MTYVKLFLKWTLLVGGMIFWFTVAVGVVSGMSTKVYDCDISEHSGYPQEVKNECRKLGNVTRT